ncbi:hypothetical protein G8O24_37855 [Bradyrhizobium sp. INPA01-394B]|uniref:Anticodon-binding domain-containing protein n=1 Tax=Bradyrhizobium campsiandrae TaxID=1729892 RepID=A0ABR7UHW6_9BRAD|nr:His/Gly/Thr/Pro-type tRNA ligase C-terminal domain-containing protein [Bradyrhizobium campsiandrae]MBC9883062.1 hypothetical protein [Bradyrhizobium campsiandrae]MBC9983569.1 hypothetical protein [Bradyrhizobium campsiandrae]
MSRLVTRLIEAGILPKTGAFSRHLLVTRSDDSSEQYRLGIVDQLRSAGVPTEAFFERSDLGTQLKYADKKGFGFAVILKPGSTRTIELRDLTLRQQHPVSEAELLARLVAA